MTARTRLTRLLRSTTAIALLGLCGTSFAAIQTRSFSATVGSGPFSATVGTGDFSWDDAAITGIGTETIDPTTSLAITFTIFGLPFTASSDSDYFAFPTLTFIGGDPTEINYLLTDGVNGVDFVDPTIAFVGIGLDLTPGETVRFETGAIVGLVPVPIPEPISALLVGFGLLGIGAQRRLKSRA